MNEPQDYKQAKQIVLFFAAQAAKNPLCEETALNLRSAQARAIALAPKHDRTAVRSPRLSRNSLAWEGREVKA